MAESFSQIYSSTYLTELEKYFEIQVNGTAIGPEWMKNITFLNLSEEENKKGLLEFEMIDPTFSHFETPLFALQQKLIIMAGYRTDYEARGPFEITNIDVSFKDVGLNLKIKGEEGGRLSRRTARRTVSSGSLKDLFMRIAQENDLEFTMDEETEGLDEQISLEDPIVQAGESDGRFLQRVAATYGWNLTTSSGRLKVGRSDFDRYLGVIELKYGFQDANTMKINAKFKKPRVSYVPVTSARGRTTRTRDLTTPHAPPTDPTGVYAPAPLTSDPSQVYQTPLASYDPSQTSGTTASPYSLSSSWEQNTTTPPSGPTTTGYAAAAAAGGVAASGETLSSYASTSSGLTLGGSGSASAGARTFINPSTGAVYSQPTSATSSGTSGGGQSLPGLYADASGVTGYGSTDSAGNSLINDASGTTLGYYDPTAGMCMVGSPDQAQQPPARVRRRKVLREGKLESVTVSLKLGSMMFRPAAKIDLVGCGSKLDGEYRVKKVSHRFADGYDTEVVLLRGHTAPVRRRRSSSTPAQNSSQPGATSPTTTPGSGGTTTESRTYVDPSTGAVSTRRVLVDASGNAVGTAG